MDDLITEVHTNSRIAEPFKTKANKIIITTTDYNFDGLKHIHPGSLKTVLFGKKVCPCIQQYSYKYTSSGKHINTFSPVSLLMTVNAFK